MQDRVGMHRIVAAAIIDLHDRRDDAANGPLVRDDAQRCIDVIETFQGAANQLDLWNADYLAPRLPSPLMNVNGVEISVAPDLIAIDRRRNDVRVGQVFIRCTIGAAGDAAEGRRSEANGHLATIAHMHASQYLTDLGTPYAPTSIVVDVPRGLVVRGPTSSARRIANIQAACAMIAAVWPTV